MLAGLNRLTGPQLRFIDEQGWVWCIGEVAAGRWREALEWPRDEWRPVAVAIADARYPGAERRALRVTGDSMDLVYPDGSFVIFVAFNDIGKRPQAGDKVVVLRHRQGQVEATVKEYHRDGQGKRWLLPRSSNPTHTPIRLAPSADESDTTEILGLVVGSQRLE